jgi:hypothetical protein
VWPDFPLLCRSQVKSLRVRTDGPLVVSGGHQGGGELHRRPGQPLRRRQREPLQRDRQFQRRDAARGRVHRRYRVRVEADGARTLRFSQPVPNDRAKRLPGTDRSEGAQVVAVRTSEDLQPVIRATHRGEPNFILDVVGYGQETSGSENLFNEIDNFNG